MKPKKVRIVEEPRALDKEEGAEVLGGLSCISYEPCSFLFSTHCGEFAEDGLCGDSASPTKIYCSGYSK